MPISGRRQASTHSFFQRMVFKNMSSFSICNEHMNKSRFIDFYEIEFDTYTFLQNACRCAFVLCSILFAFHSPCQLEQFFRGLGWQLIFVK